MLALRRRTRELRQLFIILDANWPSSKASGETHTVREFIEKSFAVAGVKIAWEGCREGEVGKDSKSSGIRVRIDPRYCCTCLGR
ncbi:hypothetical protein SmJEL517_g02347 [Synchytrium microbalum]|uniref:NAD(P)-binding domain-containing protein n=1 Tax=Synchytrium microbalum TaxID=1806994 RepID=A0A507C7T7_9FUNG|nr:uncharacterized protein SmJEL517_g02347 [Synchytrium microbalum]TPX35209.1 hypothetical protein SmJEL517_g02347 [Synchytrium microbalum]